MVKLFVAGRLSLTACIAALDSSLENFIPRLTPEQATRLRIVMLRNTPGKPISDFRGSWAKAVKEAHKRNPNVRANLLFHDLRRSAVRVMVQEAGLPESQAMLISGHKTRSMLERYNIISLKNLQDAGAKLDDWQKSRSKRSKARRTVVPIRSKRAKSA